MRGTSLFSGASGGGLSLGAGLGRFVADGRVGGSNGNFTSRSAVGAQLPPRPPARTRAAPFRCQEPPGVTCQPVENRSCALSGATCKGPGPAPAPAPRPAHGPRAPGDGLSAPHLSPGAPRRGGGAEALRGPRPRAHLHVVVLEGCSVRCGGARGSPRQPEAARGSRRRHRQGLLDLEDRVRGETPATPPRPAVPAAAEVQQRLRVTSSGAAAGGGHPASPGSGATRASTTGPSRSSARRTTRAACWRRARSRRSSPSTGRSTCGRRGRR